MSSSELIGDEDEAVARDEEVVALRSKGQSFVRIARDLGFRRGADATAAFNRALLRRPSSEQQQLRNEETSRLDRLAKGVEESEDLSAADKARRLGVIERLRRGLGAAEA
jgi:hypothetical protein